MIATIAPALPTGTGTQGGGHGSLGRMRVSAPGLFSLRGRRSKTTTGANGYGGLSSRRGPGELSSRATLLRINVI